MTLKLRLLSILSSILFVGGCASSETEIQVKSKDHVESQENGNQNEVQLELTDDEPEEKPEEKPDDPQVTKDFVSLYGLEQVAISRIVDGDTVVLQDGRKVRLIGINTPESTTRTEVYGEEAKEYTTNELDGRNVWIQKDVSETDRYSRHLRIIWLDVPTDDMNETEIRKKMFNAHLVLNGFAEPSTYPPDVKYSEYFLKFAREARESNTGLWGYGPDGTTKGDMDKRAPKSSSPPASSGGNESYQNCTELRKIYPDGVPSTHPAYSSKHDRDKDNWACE
ncbi:thermonuclease family protein [Bacillus suaedaesalsae]|uniref:thermonuclease family protein n=1 Tax=Bacillus suaedaesalsae TaxID=2810349 RepID=UPI001EF62D5E|nr:thermonuclease family protein [Bacillus suaedaesalsae]